nr:tRNA (adenosine(37)-N6)-threonylcarbamoyltransferase complex ATPase subunit type 1 TsaE [Demequina sp. TTPB684]
MIPSGDAMRALGQELAGVFRAGDLVILSGGLGAGKTTLVQGIGAGLGVRGQVASPTFIISRVHTPRAEGPVLVHVDAYRLASLDELDHLDLDASTDEAVTVVEWGEGKAETLAEGHALITIERPRGALADGEDPAAGVRTVTITTTGASWQGRSWPVTGWDA